MLARPPDAFGPSDWVLVSPAIQSQPGNAQELALIAGDQGRSHGERCGGDHHVVRADRRSERFELSA